MSVRHVKVFGEQGIYAGWPANHGAWQWGDELLVGFLRGAHVEHRMHNIEEPFQKVLSRSLDGGETWLVEEPKVDFEASTLTAAPNFDLSRSIIRVCGNYDHGGEYCARAGGFYVSEDRGKSWTGAYSFDGLERLMTAGRHGTSRTCVLAERKLVFLSAAARHHWGSDWVYCAFHDGERFALKAIVCDDDARAVMPAAAEVDGRIVVVMRRRGTRRPGGWIDAFGSDDGGETWQFLGHVADTGIHNGNPPALVEVNGRLLCAYGNRSDRAIFVNTSDDRGRTWRQAIMLRRGDCSDIGYPRLFKRTDGNLVCVYYWADVPDDHQSIQATIFDPGAL